MVRDPKPATYPLRKIYSTYLMNTFIFIIRRTFFSKDKGTAISSSTLGVIFRRAVKHAGIQKKSTFYTESEGQEYLLACDKNYLLVLAEITGNLCKVFLRISFYQPWFYFQVTT